MTITDTIMKNLKQIEEDNDCKILFAIESGSRVWGFPSVNSDYDVRFVYIRKPEYYLSIDDKRDVIEVPVDEVLDINGWDIRKALKLFRKSNPPLLEWITSNITYMDNFGFREELRNTTGSMFTIPTSLHHYLNMARRNYKEYLQADDVITKKYFYVLRPIFACLWNIRYDDVGPIKFQDIMEGIFIPEQVKNEISILLEKKMSGVELGKGPKNDILNEYIADKLHHIELYINRYPLLNKSDPTPILDEIYRKYLIRAWN